MVGFFCFLLGVLLTLAVVIGYGIYLAVTTPEHYCASADHLAHLTQLQAEHRLHQLAQTAMAQMLQAIRPER
jgi:hypothetical protein